MVPENATASTIVVHDGSITATARDGSNTLIPGEAETVTVGQTVLLKTLSATTGEVEKLSDNDPMVKSHRETLFTDRTRDPAQIVNIGENPKAVPFVTGPPRYMSTVAPDMGETIDFELTFNKPVSVTGTPQLLLTITATPSDDTKYAAYLSGAGTNALTFRYVVDVPGITDIEVTEMDQSGGSITSLEGGKLADKFIPRTTFMAPSYAIALSNTNIDAINIGSIALNVSNFGSGNNAIVSVNGQARSAVPAAGSLPLDLTGVSDGPVTVTYYEVAGSTTLLSVKTTAAKDTSDAIDPSITLDTITTPSAITTQTFTGTASDNIGTPTVQVRLSPGHITQAATVSGTTWSATVSGLSDNTYSVTARATDNAGNTTDTAPQTLEINTNLPTGTLSHIAGTPYTGSQIITSDTTPTLTGTATGGGAATVSTVEVSLDNGSTWNAATGTTSWSYTPASLTESIYSVRVRMTNSVGTTATNTFSSALRVDTTAPTVSSIAFTSPTSGTYGPGQVITATATFSEAVTGTATLPFRIAGVATSAQTCTGSGITRTCNYTLQSGDNGAVTLNANTLAGTLRDAAGNTATLTHAAVSTPVITADSVALTVLAADVVARLKAVEIPHEFDIVDRTESAVAIG
jgi:hypothetical protein